MGTPVTDEELGEILPRLRRFALSLTRDPNNADDLVQSCMERALTRAPSRRDDGDLRSWLFSIIYRQFLDSQRRAKRYGRILAFLGGVDEMFSSSTEDIALARAGLGELGKLPAEQQSLLMLVSVEGLSYKETADILDVPIGTVMSRLSRARKALRERTDGRITVPSLRVMK